MDDQGGRMGAGSTPERHPVQTVDHKGGKVSTKVTLADVRELLRLSEVEANDLAAEVAALRAEREVLVGERDKAWRRLSAYSAMIVRQRTLALSLSRGGREVAVGRPQRAGQRGGRRRTEARPSADATARPNMTVAYEGADPALLGDPYAAPDARRKRAGEMRQTLAALIHWYDNANTDGRLLGEIIYNARALLDPARPTGEEA